MKVQLGTREVEFPSKELHQLVPTSKEETPGELWEKLNTQGYLYVKDFHDRAEVLAARKAVLAYIAAIGSDKLDTSYHDLEDGVLNPRCGLGCVPFMEGVREITHADLIAKVLEGPRPFHFFKQLFGKDVLTFNYKWLRAMHRDAFTGAHVDNVYMSRGTSDLLTLWTPFGDITADMGTLALCEGSNCLDSFSAFHRTYGSLDVEDADLNGTGWFTEDPWEITGRFGGVWKTTNFEAGDVMIFNMRTVHMSTANLTKYARISCDTRWQAADEPIDERYIEDRQAPTKFGVHAKGTQEKTIGVTMEQLKLLWGFS